MTSSTDYRSRIYEHYGSRFQGAAKVFDVVAAERWGRAYRSYLRGWLPENKNASILDVACGGGRLMYFYQQNGYQNLCGVDISREQVSLARQVHTNVVEAEAINFLKAHPGEFDLISGLDIVEHLHKDEVLDFLDGCFHALRPGGRLILQTPNADAPWGTQLRYGDFTHEVCFQQESLSRLMSLCGFGGISAREQGPVGWGYSTFSTIRWIVWQGIRIGLRLYHLVETGNAGSGIFSQVFLVSGTKP